MNAAAELTKALRLATRPLRHRLWDISVRLRIYATWWWRKERPAPRHNLDGDLVVTLTSFPPRFPTLHLTLLSLLLQTRRPDHLILWIAHSDRELLPAAVMELTRHGLEVRFCDDIRSYKKIIPALNAFPVSSLITADDDLYFWPTWLEGLVTASRTKQEIVCYRAHQIVRDSTGTPLSYATWRYNVDASPADGDTFPTTGHGVLYPPHALDTRVTDVGAFQELCPTADDIWLFWMARLNGFAFRKIGTRRRFWPWIGSQAVSLYALNVDSDTGNDAQIASMAAKFGWP